MFFSEGEIDVHDVDVNNKECDHQDEGLVPGKPLENLFSGLQNSEIAASSSGNEIVYGFDEHGHQIPIAIVIDGNFSPYCQQSDINLREENCQNMPEGCQWVAGEEECLTNHFCAAEEEIKTLDSIKVENSLEFDVHTTCSDEFVSKKSIGHQNVIKVFKARGVRRGL